MMLTASEIKSFRAAYIRRHYGRTAAALWTAAHTPRVLVLAAALVALAMGLRASHLYAYRCGVQFAVEAFAASIGD